MDSRSPPLLAVMPPPPISLQPCFALAAAVLASVAFAEGITSVDIICNGLQRGNVSVTLLHDSVCVTWKNPGQRNDARAAIDACLLTEFAFSANLDSILPYGHNAVARAVQQLLTAPGRYALGGSLVALQLAYALLPIGILWGRAMTLQIPKTCCPCLAWPILCTC